MSPNPSGVLTVAVVRTTRLWFVAVSEAQRRFDEDLRYGGVVYNGIDMNVYTLQEEKEDFVLFLGRGAPEKGWRRAIDAATLAGERLVSAVKIAHWAEQKEWKENIEPVLPPGFEVLGEISQEEKVDLLRRAKAPTWSMISWSRRMARSTRPPATAVLFCEFAPTATR